MTFNAYIARDRYFRDFRFDFHIVNETARSWYDGSPNQHMPERDWCVSHLCRGMTVVDCGAHHGMMSIIFANAVGPEGRVIAYEALPGNAEVVSLNAALNGFVNIDVRPVGVGDAFSEVVVNLNQSNTVVTLDTEAGSEVDGARVQIVRLDENLGPDVHVDFIKIDVEGHDLHALRGMPRVLAQRPIVDLELHNFIFKDKRGTLEQIIEGLRSMDYRWELLGEIGGTPQPLGQALTVESVERYDNPHLFGIPSRT